MKVENKTAGASARADAAGSKKSSSSAAVTSRAGVARSNGKQGPKPVTLAGGRAAEAAFDATQHHALHYNIRGYPIELRKEKAGMQNGLVLKEKIGTYSYFYSISSPYVLV